MFEQKQLSEIFSLDPSFVKSNRELEIVSRSAKGVRQSLEKPKSSFSFVYEEVVMVLEYFKRSYVGVPLVIDGPPRGGKSDFIRQVCLRLNLCFHYFDMKVVEVSDLREELERLFMQASELRGDDLFVIHLDNVDGMAESELSSVIGSFNGKFHHKFRVVLSAEGEAVVPLKSSRKLRLSPLSSDRVLEVLMRNVDESHELNKKESMQVSVLAKTITEVCNDYFEFIPVELALTWLDDIIMRLQWGLSQGNVCIEALDAIKHCVEVTEYETILKITKDNIGQKLKMANAK